MKRKSKPSTYNYDRDFENYDDYGTQGATAKRPAGLGSLLSATSAAVLAGVLVLGIAIGLAFSSVSTSGAGKIVTQSDLDSRAPNPEVCVQFGSSAMVMDMRMFITLNPINFFVSQPIAQPGCVLRSNNWSVLEQRNLVNSQQVRECKQRMNTFGFTGRLESSPKVDCIYQNDAAQNLFLDRGINGTTKPENDRF